MPFIKGKRAVLEALKAGHSLSAIHLVKDVAPAPELALLLTLANDTGVPVYTATKDQIEAMAQEGNTQGIIAKMATRKELSMADLLGRDHPTVLVVDHLEDPFNFGAIMRSAELFGARGIVFPKDRHAALTPGVMKAASGAIHYLDLVRVANIGNAIDQLKRQGYWVYGTTPEQGVLLRDWAPSGRVALVVGNEQRGISQRVLRQCDGLITIETCGQLASLNVSVATGILLHHVMTHRSLSGEA